LPNGPGGGPGLLVDDEFARALRCEAPLAIRYWWRASETSVWAWRKALGVERHNEGSVRLRAVIDRENGDLFRGLRLSDEQCDLRAANALRLGLRPPPHPGGRPWTEAELALLGTLPDDEVAVRIGRTTTAVRVQRLRLKIPTARDG
jgi:hypothetical protein